MVSYNREPKCKICPHAAICKKLQATNAPVHCIGCPKFLECKRAEFMSADTEPVPGFIANADCWCLDCRLVFATSAENPETDHPLHCAGCGRPLECRLTDDGVQYVKDSLLSGVGCCRELWPVLFADYL